MKRVQRLLLGRWLLPSAFTAGITDRERAAIVRDLDGLLAEGLASRSFDEGTVDVFDAWIAARLAGPLHRLRDEKAVRLAQGGLLVARAAARADRATEAARRAEQRLQRQVAHNERLERLLIGEAESVPESEPAVRPQPPAARHLDGHGLRVARSVPPALPATVAQLVAATPE